MTQASPGVIKALYQTRNHVAEVRITYTATYYNIKYDSSLNLQASDGKIHKNYNRWVRALDKDIQVNSIYRSNVIVMLISGWNGPIAFNFL